jgi:hypothetical protein
MTKTLALTFALALCASAAPGLSPVNRPPSSGVTNTGNATATDVASGKTFSSASLTNATGTSTANATVDATAVILPAQKFVDVITSFIPDPNEPSDGIALLSMGLTKVDGTLLVHWAGIYAYLFGNPAIDLSGNALSVASVNDILNKLAGSGLAHGSLNLSGGTNAAPTGQGLTDKDNLEFSGWSVTTN